MIILNINLLNRKKNLKVINLSVYKQQILINFVFEEYKYIFIAHLIKEYLWANGQNIRNNSLTKMFLKKY